MSKKYVIAAWEFFGTWIYQGLYPSSHTLQEVYFTHEFEEAAEFETLEEAEAKRDYLNETYCDYDWYILIEN